MDYKQIWDEIVGEIQRRRDLGETLESIGRNIGRSKAYVHKVLAGSVTGENINADKIRRYRAGLGLPFLAEQQHDTANDFQLVQKVKAQLGAGSSLITDDSPDGHYAFRRDWLRSLGFHAKPVLMHVVGESMQPTLLHGDMVMIDKADTQIKSGKLYAVGIGDELLIKRVFTSPSGAIVLKSDNPDFPTWEVPACDDPRIIGRAKWVGRML